MFDTIASSAGGNEGNGTTSTIKRKYSGSRMRSTSKWKKAARFVRRFRNLFPRERKRKTAHPRMRWETYQWYLTWCNVLIRHLKSSPVSRNRSPLKTTKSCSIPLRRLLVAVRKWELHLLSEEDITALECDQDVKVEKGSKIYPTCRRAFSIERKRKTMHPSTKWGTNQQYLGRCCVLIGRRWEICPGEKLNSAPSTGTTRLDVKTWMRLEEGLD